MFVPTPISAILVLLAPLAIAYLITRRLRLPRGTAVRALSVLVLWEVLELVPVHLLAGLQLLGWIARVSMREVAALDLVLLVAVTVWALRKSGSQIAPSLELKERLPSHVLIAGAILALSYLALAVNAFSSFPIGPDALIYHLPLAARWLQTGSLTMPASHPWRLSLPSNAEVGMMVLLSTGVQSAVVIASWIPLAIIAVSTYMLAMWIGGQNRTAAMSCVILALSIPMLEAQALSAYVDLFGTAGILAAIALAFATEWREKGVLAGSVALLAGLSCGISIGTKPVYHLYAVLFCVAIAGALWMQRAAGSRLLGRAAGVIVAGLLIPSLFWFARAAGQTGNPLYPTQVEVAGRVVLHGVPEIAQSEYEFNSVRRKYEWFVYPWTEWKRLTGYLKVPYGEGDGLGAAFATFVPLGLLYLAFEAKAERRRRSRNLALLAAFAAMFLTWWARMEGLLRFAEVIVVFACALSAPMIVLLQSRYRRAFAALFMISIAATSLIMASVPMHLVAGRMRKHLWSRAAVYGYPDVIDKLPSGSVVVNATGAKERNFELFGRALQNRVITSVELPKAANALRGDGAEYVVEVVPGGIYSSKELSAAGAVVVDDENVPTGDGQVRWRIWKLQ